MSAPTAHPVTHPSSDAVTPALEGGGPGADEVLLAALAGAVHEAGAVLLERFRPLTALHTMDEVVAALEANDAAALAVLRPALAAARPGAGWVEGELDGGELPPGEWWVVDPVEGNINHVHGLEEWAVTATLVRDGEPALTAVHLPLTGTTYTAVRGAGAHQDGARLRGSVKTELAAAMVGTSQASPAEDAEAHRRIAASVEAMLGAGLVVRAAVPATLHLVQVAAGRLDVFWQLSDVRADHLAGALLAREAGAVVTDVRGRPWSLASEDFLAAAPGVHAAAVRALTPVL